VLSSKVVDFGTNRKRVCDFLLDINSNICSILPHFRDIAGFLLKKASHPYSTLFYVFYPNFGVRLRLDCRCWGSEERRPSDNYSNNYFRTTSTSQTDGRTVDISIPRNNSYIASRRKNDVGTSYYVQLLRVSLLKSLTAANNVNGLVDQGHTKQWRVYMVVDNTTYQQKFRNWD